MDETKELLKKKNKIFEWIKKPEHYWILIVLGISLIIRLYYFFLVQNQPVWWDEADYLNIAKHWVIGMDYPVNVIRPLLLPIIISGFYLLGLGETSIRIFILLCSLLSILLIYLIGDLLFNKKVGIISAVLLSGFWSFTFFTYRILVDVPLTFLFLACIYSFFYAYLKNKSWKYFILPGVFLGLGFLMKFTSAVLIAIFGIYLLTTEKFSVFKNKKIWVFSASALITVLPFFIWEKIKYGSFFAFFSSVSGSINPSDRPGLISSFFGHLFASGNFLTIFLEVIFFISLLWFLFEYVLIANSSFQKESVSNKYYFTLLWVFLGLIMFAWLFSANSAEERYYFIFYPAIFLIISKLLVDIYGFVKKYNKSFAVILVSLILIVSLYPSFTQADQIIKNKMTSFKELKQAGTWINQHTNKTESFLVIEESAETVYYAEREYNIENHNIANTTDLLNRIKLHNPSYIVLSFYYYLGRNGDGGFEMLNSIFTHPEAFQVVQTYGPFIDEQKSVPLVIILKINKDKINFN